MVEQIIRWVKLGLTLGVVFVLLWVQGTYGCHRISGMEMQPALMQSSTKLYTYIDGPGDLRPSDMVIFDYVGSSTENTSRTGRIIGLPGDRVRIVEGLVYVNGKERTDSIAEDERSYEDMAEIVVPSDCFFVLCDARRSSPTLDSRGVGPVSFWALRGKLN